MYKLTLCYDGTAYHGWQRQKNALAVQEVLEDALARLFKHDVTVAGCSRTDAGVHAKEYVCSFDYPMSVPAEKLPYALNTIIPDDISVIGCEKTSDDFHARFSCKGKEYIYLIDNSTHINPFLRNYACHFPYKLDFEKMLDAASFMHGKRDYSAFCASGATVKDFVRNLEYVKLSKEGNVITLRTKADGYLYNMVRIIAGTLLYVGVGKIESSDITDIIDSKDRRAAGITAPPQGLYLNHVYY